MALKKTDPWYVSPDLTNIRYKRALALSRMQHEITVYECRPELAARYADAIAYRKHCIANWPQYLDGQIDPPTGRKPRSG